MLKKLFYGVFDFILPPVCIHCEGILEDGDKYLCKNCSASIIRIDNSNNIVANRLKSPDLVSNAYSFFLFKEETPIQTLIHSFKYGQMKRIGTRYGRLLAETVLLYEDISPCYIIPVPLHVSKKRERGYNQSDFISNGISAVLNVPALPKCLKRKKFTQTQTKLSREERQKNVSDAFELREKYKERIKGENIIIVDDVITTGATILECARVLKTGGCGEITVCSIALAE